jgi:hypothetical protein
MPAPQENTINSRLSANHCAGNLLASRPPAWAKLGLPAIELHRRANIK